MCSVSSRGLTSTADSSPRTQWVTFTGSPRTFWRPSFFISARIQSIAASRLREPACRWPKPSTSRPSRS